MFIHDAIRACIHVFVHACSINIHVYMLKVKQNKIYNIHSINYTLYMAMTLSLCYTLTVTLTVLVLFKLYDLYLTVFITCMQILLMLTDFPLPFICCDRGEKLWHQSFQCLERIFIWCLERTKQKMKKIILKESLNYHVKSCLQYKGNYCYYISHWMAEEE